MVELGITLSSHTSLRWAGSISKMLGRAASVLAGALGAAVIAGCWLAFHFSPWWVAAIIGCLGWVANLVGFVVRRVVPKVLVVFDITMEPQDVGKVGQWVTMCAMTCIASITTSRMSFEGCS
jgi:hypothetical protein